MPGIVQSALGGRRPAIGICVVVSACAGLAAFMLGLGTAPAAGQQRAAAATIVTVTAGRPSEFAFSLSRSSALPWPAKAGSATVTFRVANRGALSHQFKVCAAPVASASLNACSGTATGLLGPGQTQSLTVTFKHPGTYEFLSGIPGQAAKGLKGVIRIGSSVSVSPAATTPAKAAATTTPTTSPSASTSPTVAAPTGSAGAGAALWESGGCVSCHSLGDVRAAAGGNIPSSLNSTHTGGPFPNGPLTATQISQVAAYING